VQAQSIILMASMTSHRLARSKYLDVKSCARILRLSTNNFHRDAAFPMNLVPMRIARLIGISTDYTCISRYEKFARWRKEGLFEIKPRVINSNNKLKYKFPDFCMLTDSFLDIIIFHSGHTTKFYNT